MNKQVCTNKMGYILALLGIVLLLAGVFLPYMTAVGEMAEYIDQNPERMELASENLTAGDLKNIPITRTGKLITGVYGEDDGLAATVILLVLGGLGALTALVAALKKPIGALIFDLLTIGTFVFLNDVMKEDFIGGDKYAWGVGFYAIIAALVIVMVGAVWMLAMNSAGKKAGASSDKE